MKIYFFWLFHLYFQFVAVCAFYIKSILRNSKDSGYFSVTCKIIQNVPLYWVSGWLLNEKKVTCDWKPRPKAKCAAERKHVASALCSTHILFFVFCCCWCLPFGYSLWKTIDQRQGWILCWDRVYISQLLFRLFYNYYIYWLIA